MSTKPTKEKVAATIKKVFGTHRSPNGEKFNRLLYKHESEGINCYCIEGIFCEAAVQLGYEGKFLEPSTKTFVSEVDKEKPQPFSFFAHNGFRSVAPETVFEFLGLPRELKPEDLSKHGLNKDEIVHQNRELGGRIGDNFEWNFIHDCTKTTLKELVDAALAILSKK